MRGFIKAFLNDQSGATAIEYGLIAALISTGIIASAANIGKTVSNTFTTIGTSMAAK